MVAQSLPNNNSTNGRTTSFEKKLRRAQRFVGAAGYVSPRLGAQVARKIWETPKRFDTPSREAALLSTASKVRIPLGLHSLAGWSWGAQDAPTILLVHGWEGRGGQLAGFAHPLVERGYRVIAFDAPGHGKNPRAQASLFAFADAVQAASRTFGPLHGIIAHSLGCAASMLALSAGIPAQSVVFVAPADASEGPARFSSMLGLSDAVRRELFADLQYQYGATFDDVSVATLAPKMTAKLRVLHDHSDRFAPVSDAERIVAAWPNSELQLTEHLGHHRILRDPGVIASAAAFFEVRPGASGLRPGSSVHPWNLTEADLEADLRYGRDR